ncbi:Uncharacterized protein Adt_41348 [Abeliophyllum distichum]|uniref:DUF1985 domain-containing protein n=1 Tax=Abeliophyllum distichum TaxID=126358 RepID=A0ABD1PNK8_9LAMI
MVSAPHDVILNLNARMNEAQKRLFGISCFGNFLDLNEIYLQHQLIHKMLLIEVKQQKPDEMWFNIAGKTIEIFFTRVLSCYWLKRKQVTDAMFNLVESDDVRRYAWGKDLFDNTFNYLKIALSKRTYNETTKKDIFTYRLYSYPLAFQIWIYESLPSLDGKIYQMLFYTWLRLLNWTNTATRVTVAQLDKIDFDQPDMEVQGIQLNEEERG